jgi:hypothetical protein
VTENDLWEYFKCTKERNRVEGILKDYESRIRAVGGQVLTGMPIDPNPYPEDKMALIAHRRDELKRQLKKAEADLARAHANITLALMYLFGDERTFFEKRYIEGKRYEIIMREMHISRPTSCRLRCHILDTVKPL